MSKAKQHQRVRVAKESSPSSVMHLAPAVLVSLAIILGGASEAGWLPHLILQLTAVVLLCGTLWFADKTETLRSARGLWLMFAGCALLAILHIVPIPAELWSKLPGRSLFIENYGMLGQTPGSLAFSLDPAQARLGSLALIPVLCGIVLTLQAGRRGFGWLAGATVSIAVLSIFVGIAQLTGGGSNILGFYSPDQITTAAGFFANQNHLATLLSASIPLLAALYVELTSYDEIPARFVLTATLSVGAFIIIGVLLTGSVAGMLMVGPVTLVSAKIMMRDAGKKNYVRVILGGILLLVASTAVVLSSDNAPGWATNFGDEALDRRGINKASLDLAKVYWPVGAGIGSFERIYQVHENQESVTNVFVNHAHNEYLEIAVEAGLPGLILVLMVLLWCAKWTYFAWFRGGDEAYWSRAASLCIWIIAAHSLVDYPARTFAILVLGACCLAMLRMGIPSQVAPRT